MHACIVKHASRLLSRAKNQKKKKESSCPLIWKDFMSVQFFMFQMLFSIQIALFSTCQAIITKSFKHIWPVCPRPDQFPVQLDPQLYFILTKRSFTETRMKVRFLMSKPGATVARKNSLSWHKDETLTETRFKREQSSGCPANSGNIV